MVDISVKYRESIHEILLSQRVKSKDQLEFYRDLNIWFQAILTVLANDDSYLEGYEILFEECRYLREKVCEWIESGRDLFTEIDNAGWRDRENAEKWWCEL